MITTLIALHTFSKSSSISVTATLGKKPAANVVVWLLGAGKPNPGRFVISQKNKKFDPRILVVPTGSTVSFPNRDEVFHNVFAEYNAKKFDLGMYPKGQSREVTFDKSGVVSVLCNVHSSMSAFVVVVDSAIYGMTNSKGMLTLEDVPKGSYDLLAWHESGVKISEPVTVADAPIKKTLQLKK